jgi:hypothetical protein
MKQRVVVWGQRVEVDKTPHRPRLVALRGQLGLKLLDGSDADAVKLRELDDANAGLEIGDDGRGLVGWNGRAAEPHAAGARKPGRSTSDNRGLGPAGK